MMNVLTRDEMLVKAPSIFNREAYHKVSENYKVYSTIDVVDAFEREGWLPVTVGQQKCKVEDRKGFQKHLIRFRHRDNLATTDKLVPEVVLTNSNDGSSAYNLMAGLFRFVCGNGIIVADSTINRVRVVHKGSTPQDVIEASYQVITELPRAIEEIDSMRAIDLNLQEQTAFANAAYALKYDTEEQDYNKKAQQINPVSLLIPRRTEDQKNDLFTTFNRVQENLIKGGRGKNNRGYLKQMRATNSINQSIAINTALWVLTQEMAKIKLGRAL